MFNPIAVFSLATALLALLFIALSLMVIVRRRETRVAFKDGQDNVLLRRIRAHANFVEYVPLALILMGLAILLQISPVVFLLDCLLFVIGRFIHVFGILSTDVKRQIMGRIIGMILTLFPMLFLAFYVLIKGFIILIHS